MAKSLGQTITPSRLRANIYKYLDEVAKQGKTLEINRDGVLLQLSPKEKPKIVNNLKKLKKRKLLLCKDQDLFDSQWEKEWNQDPS